MALEFKPLWQQHAPGIGRLVKSYEANHHEQQELMQEIGLAIWRALPACKDANAVKAFIYRIAHNQAVNHISRQVKRPKTAEVELETLVDNAISKDNNQLQQKLIENMRDLPLNQKQVIGLLFEGFSYQQIADITGLSMSNVGALINRGKQKLQASLNE